MCLGRRLLCQSEAPSRTTDWRRFVKGIDLDIAAGETLAVVGDSGSGKGVTLLAAIQLLPRYASRVEGKCCFAARIRWRFMKSRCGSFEAVKLA
ncbi:hypothetical protein RGR602_CH03312 [Rhizobium gallicum bv. gallicum R602sp]|uniref:ABC transporter domain-containing protein n=1 Tax=Rhizobium gallicum bv. gallicum R602sp TaxID=1041138 RepID=A0A0B4X640_9HYPH|nr:hypothetical protein RGR602_CH03312 [Rhizobium gallicum bv. gallicum R602sp]